MQTYLHPIWTCIEAYKLSLRAGVLGARRDGDTRALCARVLHWITWKTAIGPLAHSTRQEPWQSWSRDSSLFVPCCLVEYILVADPSQHEFSEQRTVWRTNVADAVWHCNGASPSGSERAVRRNRWMRRQGRRYTIAGLEPQPSAVRQDLLSLVSVHVLVRGGFAVSSCQGDPWAKRRHDSASGVLCSR